MALLASAAFLGLAGCSGTGQKPNAEGQFCSFIFSLGDTSSSAIAVTRGTGEDFSDAGLRTAAEHFTSAIQANNRQALSNAESQVEAACQRLDDWQTPATAP
jgi:hypothetical protein